MLVLTIIAKSNPAAISLELNRLLTPPPRNFIHLSRRSMTTPVADLGQDGSGAAVAVEDSGPADNPASVVDPGHGQDATDELSAPAENPCLMTQLRQRWLLALVQGQLGGTFSA